MKTLNDYSFLGKKVIVRTGYDVLLDDRGNVIDNSRIKDSLYTIKFLLKQRSKIIIITHLGRPDGKIVDSLKTNSVAKELARLLKKNVTKIDSCIGKDVIDAISSMKSGSIIMLENLRFYKEEENNDENFAKELASFADYYVDEAFSCSHRAHASISGIPRFIPHYAGLSLEKEVNALILKDAKKPLVVIIGGLKLETKIPVIKNFISSADKILVGGAMIFTFYKALGIDIGKSVCDDKLLSVAKEILSLGGEKIVLPIDVICAKDKESEGKKYLIQKIPSDMLGFDIGPKTLKLFKSIISDANTVVWNGPMGMFEKDEFSKGTFGLVKILANSKAKVIVGGGESETAVNILKKRKKFFHVSTGGGASLELLSGKELPGIKALD